MDNNQQSNNNSNYYSQQPPQQPQQPQQPPQGQPPVHPLVPKNIVLCIVLSVVTCGIYAIYWMYTLNEDLRAMTKDPSAMSGGMVILLAIVTCGIFSLYWMFKQGDSIDKLKTQRGVPSSNTGIIYLVLSVIGVGIICYCLMQNEINNLITSNP